MTRRFAADTAQALSFIHPSKFRCTDLSSSQNSPNQRGLKIRCDRLKEFSKRYTSLSISFSLKKA
jgi:hypothetical protein